MKHRNLVIEKKEYVIIKRVLNLSGFQQDSTLQKSISKLSKEMESATIYDEDHMPDDVVRLHTIVTVTTKNGWRKSFKLVLPKESDFKNDKISLLTPMGAAVLGYAEGDSLLWNFPSGEQKLTIEKVEQQKTPMNINSEL